MHQRRLFILVAFFLLYDLLVMLLLPPIFFALPSPLSLPPLFFLSKFCSFPSPFFLLFSPHSGFISSFRYSSFASLSSSRVPLPAFSSLLLSS
jgi:hypothetical protein